MKLAALNASYGAPDAVDPFTGRGRGEEVWPGLLTVFRRKICFAMQRWEITDRTRV